MGLFRKCAGGYIGIANGRETKLMHIVIAEMAIKKPLPPKAVVHHVDGDKRNNWPFNLVICQDQRYHKLLHQRQAALEACGDANKLKCKFCGEYDSIENLRIYTSKTKNIHHAECNRKYLNDRYAKRTGK